MGKEGEKEEVREGLLLLFCGDENDDHSLRLGRVEREVGAMQVEEMGEEGWNGGFN